ncbi:MAG: hypothetical protein ACW98U_05070 [Candidatus Thorarchaeota archaeon]
MQTRNNQYLSAFLMLLIVLSTASFIIQSPVGQRFAESALLIDSDNPLFGQESDRIVSPTALVQDIWSLSETHTQVPTSGTLNPVLVEQSGYFETGNVTARTDTATNTEQSLTIDTDHDWVASQAEVDVWNLEKMYVVNGTFDQGIPGYTINPNGTLESYPFGWSAISNTSDIDQNQLVSYEDSGRHYISVLNQAEVTNNPNHIYTHFAGTTVFWNQTIDVTPHTDEFLLSFEYLYLQGLLNPSFSGDFSLQVLIDDKSVYNIDLPSLSERGTWFSTGTIPITVDASPGLSMLMIGLVINNTMVVDGDNDYDLDGFPDEATNTQYINVYVDDISLNAASPPDCDDVALEFSVNGFSQLITGSGGNGFGQIVNQSYWDTSSLGFSMHSNTSVSFDYNARLLNHRFINSSWTINTLEQGVAYTIESGMSGKLELYTYLGFLGVYDDLTLHLSHPEDWQNITVFDPFLSDVTSSCILDGVSITIPEALLDRLGWWKITSDAPNYASSGVVERYDSGVPDWVTEDIFHSSDSARLSVSVGTGAETPILTDPVNFTWTFPNGTIWTESSATGGVGTASSSPVIFGPTNTTAGIWGVRYLWSNGSELAYICYDFTLHHTAVLELVFSDTLATVVGQPVTVVLRFLDSETGQYLLNDGASVVGQWAGPDVVFVADVVNNWWQADFETALVGAGKFTVSLVSAAPYFETVPLEITITSHFLTTLDTPTGPLTPLIYGRHYSFDYLYAMSFNGTGIDDATVEVTETGSEWTTVSNTGNGHYTLTLEPLGSTDYSIRITFSKVGYENQTHVLSFLVNDVGIEVESISALVGTELAPFTIEVQIVESDTHNPVTGANVTLAVYRPGDLLYHAATMDEFIAGTYSTTILMPETGSGTYSIRISVAKDNHELTQSFSSTLVPTIEPTSRLFRTLMTYSWQILIFVTFIIGAVAGQRVRKRRRREIRATALTFKNRITDANNILGFLVLHKLSGVPVYSKVFKGGFEEGMLSAFITAIMHFREEFETGGKSDTFTLIPLSEVIRIVPTQNLICAFITVTPPSFEQERKMISYTRAIGMMFDDTLVQPNGPVIDAKTSKTFEWLLDDLLDTILLRTYQSGLKKFPRRLRFVEKAIPIEESDGSFNLYRLVRLLTSTEDSEDNVYIRIIEALEGEYILPIYPYNRDEFADSS